MATYLGVGRAVPVVRISEKAFAVRFAEMEEAADMVVLVVNAEKALRLRVCQAEGGKRGWPAEPAADGPVFFHQLAQCHFFVRFLLAAGSGSGHGCPPHPRRRRAFRSRHRRRLPHTAR